MASAVCRLLGEEGKPLFTSSPLEIEAHVSHYINLEVKSATPFKCPLFHQKPQDER
ncbi:MAG: hypothetical protein ACK4WF_05340 [Candidatus Brocadiales bacterium]